MNKTNEKQIPTMGFIGVPIGMSRKLLAQMDGPLANALHAITEGAMSLDGKRQTVRQMQIANLNQTK